MRLTAPAIRGWLASPYFFDQFVIGTVISTKINIYKDLELNYNGQTKTFDVKRGEKILELDPKAYLRVDIDPKLNPGLEEKFGGKKIIFQRGLHEKLEEDFAQIVYGSPRTILLKKYLALLPKKKFVSVGSPDDLRHFFMTSNYYILKEGELINILLKEKSILKALDNSKELRSYAEEQKIDFSSEHDLIKLIMFYESTL